MFPRPQRLTEPKIFTTLFRRGQWVRGKLFSLVVMPSRESGQIAFVVTKKVTKSAVRRNGIKRRLRAAFQNVLDENDYTGLLKRYHMVVVIHQDNQGLTFSSLEEQVRRQLHNISTLPPAAPKPRK